MIMIRFARKLGLVSGLAAVSLVAVAAEPAHVMASPSIAAAAAPAPAGTPKGAGPSVLVNGSFSVSNGWNVDNIAGNSAVLKAMIEAG